MKSVYAHFPINVAVLDNGDSVDVRNFLGEKYTRHVCMLPGVKCSASSLKDEFLLQGNDIEMVSRSGKDQYLACYKFNDLICNDFVCPKLQPNECSWFPMGKNYLIFQRLNPTNSQTVRLDVSHVLEFIGKLFTQMELS